MIYNQIEDMIREEQNLKGKDFIDVGDLNNYVDKIRDQYEGKIDVR